MELNIPMMIGIGAVLLLFVVFLVYRNMKDEKDYEMNADDPHALKKPPIADKERQEKRI